MQPDFSLASSSAEKCFLHICIFTYALHIPRGQAEMRPSSFILKTAPELENLGASDEQHQCQPSLHLCYKTPFYTHLLETIYISNEAYIRMTR